MNTSSDFDYGLVAGMGLDFLLGGMVLNLDARYSLGMFTVNNTGLDICNTVITFSVGLGSRM